MLPGHLDTETTARMSRLLLCIEEGRQMNADHKLSNARNATLASGARNAPQTSEQRALSLTTEPPKVANDQRSSDPYNTSGSFDRKKNWARVGKR